jgi:O-antigen/teichoic acid export membrane protein
MSSAGAASATPSLRQRLVGGGAWALVGRGGSLLLNFATTALITRFLIPTDAGAYMLAQSVVTVSAMIARLGLEYTVVFLVSSALGANDPARARLAMRTVLVLGVGTTTGVAGALTLGGARFIGASFFDSPELAGLGTMVGVWCGALALQTLFSEAFRGFHAIREAVLHGGVVSTALTVLGLLVAHSVAQPVTAIAAASITAFATMTGAGMALVGLARKTRALPRPTETTRKVEYAEVLRGAFPVLISNVMTLLLAQVGIWAVGAYLPERDVAVFSAASRMVTLVGVSFIIANQVLPPIIGELAARGDKALMERTLRGVAFAVGLPAAAVLAVFIFAGGFVMRTAFGAFYGSGAALLAILGIGQLASVFTGSSAVTLLMTGRGVAAMWIAGATGVAATVASFAAVRAFGATGVAWAISGVTVVQQLVTLLVVRRLVGVWTHASLGAALDALRRLQKRPKGDPSP